VIVDGRLLTDGFFRPVILDSIAGAYFWG